MAKLTRRNTIIGLGALVGGTGALAASGAFTAVEAQRTVDIETAGDADALLALEPHDPASLVQDETGGVVSFELDGSEDINLRARTRFDEELMITNNGDSTVAIDILSDFSPNGRSLITENTVVSFDHNTDVTENDSPDVNNVGSGESVVFDIEINLLDDHIDNSIDTDTDYGGEESPIDDTSTANGLLDQDFGEGDGDYVVISAEAN